MRPPINTKIQRHIIDLVIQADNRRNTETGISSTIRNTNERTKTYQPFQSGGIGNILMIFIQGADIKRMVIEGKNSFTNIVFGEKVFTCNTYTAEINISYA